jgi:Helicase associated domain.
MNSNVPPETSSRESNWWSRYHRIAHVADDLGRLPRRSDDVDARDVAWLANQRRSVSHTPEQTRALERLPGWFETTRGGAWQVRAEQLRRFIDEHGRRPRQRSVDSTESALAHWYSRQLVARRKGQLAPQRVTIMAYVMRSVDTERHWE